MIYCTLYNYTIPVPIYSPYISITVSAAIVFPQSDAHRLNRMRLIQTVEYDIFTYSTSDINSARCRTTDRLAAALIILVEKIEVIMN